MQWTISGLIIHVPTEKLNPIDWGPILSICRREETMIVGVESPMDLYKFLCTDGIMNKNKKLRLGITRGIWMLIDVHLIHSTLCEHIKLACAC